jgi:hypothetical protein
MKKALILGLAISVSALGAAAPAAAINCAQVKKMLEMGRSVDDIATTMVVDVSEVEKCKEEAEKPAPTPAGEPQ